MKRYFFSGILEGMFFGPNQYRRLEILLPGADMTLFLEGDIEKNEDPDKANTEKKGDKI